MIRFEKSDLLEGVWQFNEPEGVFQHFMPEHHG
jgi:hypothetical protein